ncbi:membrane protein [Ralstonia solanacearum]|uniref:membrane protein n=1 Tax=Ralstonia solanacearum TaxID=305 RepID=UPI0001D94B72|nr:membrane protein [Ralstonia solanacearum]CBJ42999.1 putative phage-related exported protein [Ralstonia solanacearum CFBP2957]
MTVQVEFWQMVTMLGAFLGFMLGAGKVLLSQIERRQAERDQRQEEQISTLLKQISKEAETVSRLEREFMSFKADLPLQYVRREDYVRGQSVIEAKLDALYNKLEVVQMKGVNHG